MTVPPAIARAVPFLIFVPLLYAPLEPPVSLLTNLVVVLVQHRQMGLEVVNWRLAERLEAYLIVLGLALAARWLLEEVFVVTEDLVHCRASQLLGVPPVGLAGQAVDPLQVVAVPPE